MIGSYPVQLSNRYGVSYRRTVEVREDETATVSVAPATVTLAGVPTKSIVTLNGEDVAVSDAGLSLNLLPGRYTARLSGEWVSDEEETITVAAGTNRTVTFGPVRYGQVNLSADGEVVVQIDGTPARGTVRLPAGAHTVRARLSDDVEWAHQASFEVPYGETVRLRIPALEYSVTYRVNELVERRSVLQEDLARVNDRRRLVATGGWVSLGAGVVGTGLGVLGYVLGADAYADYQAAPDTASAAAARARLETAGLMLSIGGGISIGTLLMLMRPDDRALEEEINGIGSRIRTLEEQR